MNQKDLILLVAKDLPFTFGKEELAIACWKRYPDQFGMRGYPHPSTHRVFCLLSHKYGPVRIGHLTPPPDMSLTSDGKKRLSELLGIEMPVIPPGTEAERKWAEHGGRDRITLTDAAEFFGLPVFTLNPAKSAGRVLEILGDLAQNDTPAGRVRYHLADYLAERFGLHFGLLKERTRM